MAKTVVGLYSNVEHARMAVQELVNMGVPRSDISLMSRAEGEKKGLVTDTTRVDHPVAETPTEAGEGAAAGAGVGAALGGLGGLLVGLGALAIPGIGPILAAGPLVAALTGAALGAGVGALVGALVGMGVPEEEAEYYAEGVRRGGTLVAVSAAENRVSEVTAVLRRHNPVDIKRQAVTWRESGWKGYDPNAKPLTQEELANERQTFPLEGGDVPEGKRGVYTNETYPREHADTARGEERRTHVASKTTATTMDRTYPAVRPWEDYATDFQRDFERRWKGTAAKWETYQPVYRYAYDAAYDPRYRDRNWDEVEPELRRNWETNHDTVWNNIKDAVRAAWDKVRGY